MSSTFNMSKISVVSIQSTAKQRDFLPVSVPLTTAPFGENLPEISHSSGRDKENERYERHGSLQMERMASKQGHAYHAYLGGGFKYL